MNTRSPNGVLDAQDRERFEAWHLRKFGWKPVRISAMDGKYKTHSQRVAWDAYQGALSDERTTPPSAALMASTRT